MIREKKGEKKGQREKIEVAMQKKWRKPSLGISLYTSVSCPDWTSHVNYTRVMSVVSPASVLSPNRSLNLNLITLPPQNLTPNAFSLTFGKASLLYHSSTVLIPDT